MNKTITLPYEEYLELESLKTKFDEKVKERELEYEKTYIYNCQLLRQIEKLSLIIIKAESKIDNYNKLNWWDRIFNKV